MAKVRSPNYPVMDLEAALETVRPAWKAENRNKMSRTVLARHMGYTSLNGRALGKIGAVRAYGLIDGSGDELRISDDAVLALAAPDRRDFRVREALLRLALKPQLFQDLKKEYATLPSEENVRFNLIQRHFTEDAAGKAAKSFLDTMHLVFDESTEYNPLSEIEGGMQPAQSTSLLDRSPSSIQRPPMVQEKFDLEEGPVALSVPSVLSPESYQDLADRIEILLRGLKRRSDAEAKLKE